MQDFETYIKEVKEQLFCNATDDYKNQYVTYMYTNEQVDSNLDYFKDCMSKNLSPYKALLFFDENERRQQ